MYSYPETSHPSSNFTRMEACSDLKAELLYGFSDCASALHGSGGSVEYGQHAVTGLLYKMSSITPELALDCSVVVLEEILPRSVPKAADLLC